MSETTTSATTTTPATDPATAGAGSGTTTATASTAVDWTSGLNEDMKGFVQNKGFKDPTSVLDSYRNLEKLIGQKERLVTLPEKEDDAEGWGKIYDRLGRPAKPEEYKLDVPKDGNPEFAKWAQGAFHELGLTAKQGEKLVAKWNELNTSEATKTVEAKKLAGEQAELALKKEWGAAYEQNVKMVDRAGDALGLSDKHLDGMRAAMGPAEALKFLHSLAEKIGTEHNFVGGDGKTSGFNKLTPAAALNRIAALKSDPGFVSKYAQGDVGAREEMNNLHIMAYSS